MSDYHLHLSQISALSQLLPTLPCRQVGRQKRGPSQRREFRVFYQSCDQVLVSEATAKRRAEQAGEAVKRVAAHIAITEPKGKLANITVQVFRAGVVIDTVNAALEDGKNALNTIRGYIAPNILARTVVDAFVFVEQPADTIIDGAFVGVYGRADLHMPINKTHRIPPADRRLHLHLDTPRFAFAPCYDGRFADSATPAIEALLLVLRILAATDIAFVDFDDASQFSRVVAAGFSKSLEHKPCGLLGDADLRVELQAADAFPGGYEQIHCIKPFVERHLRPLKYRAGANRKHDKISVAAVKAGASCVFPNALALAAGGADRAFRPPLPFKVGPRCLIVGKPLKQFKRADAGLAHKNMLSGDSCPQSHYVVTSGSLFGIGVRDIVVASPLAINKLRRSVANMRQIRRGLRPPLLSQTKQSSDLRGTVMLVNQPADVHAFGVGFTIFLCDPSMNGVPHSGDLFVLQAVKAVAFAALKNLGHLSCGENLEVGHFVSPCRRDARLPPDKSITIRHIRERQQKSSLMYIIPIKNGLRGFWEVGNNGS